MTANEDAAMVDTDVAMAQKAVVIHAPQEWPTGTFFVNCGAGRQMPRIATLWVASGTTSPATAR